ncbi:maleylpyruvate isomerase family mycothiol-dependent enzyme [Rhodococcus aerolatus]
MDPTREWPAAQRRVIDLVAGLGPDELATTVPACPDWTVQDLLAHVIGVGVDVVNGDEVDDHNPTWTQAHVDARRGRSLDALLAEWTELTPQMVSWMQERPGPGSRPVLDLTIHEQDLRGALGQPGARDNEGLAYAFGVFTDRVAPGLRDARLDPLELTDGEFTELLGTSSAGQEPGAVLQASRFDLLRMMLGRRSADQVRSWVVRGDVEPYLEHVSAFGSLRGTPLEEPGTG